MQVCYEYVGLAGWWAQLSAEGQAGWLSAIGGLLAVAITVLTYLIDHAINRSLRREELAEKRAETRAKQAELAAIERGRAQARKHSAWKQATLVCSIVSTAQIRMTELVKRLDGPPRLLTHEEEKLFVIQGLDSYAAALTDTAAFDEPTEILLLNFLTSAEQQNRLIQEALKRSVEGVEVRKGVWSPACRQAQSVGKLAEMLTAALRAIINSRADRRQTDDALDADGNRGGPRLPESDGSHAALRGRTGCISSHIRNAGVH